MSRPQVIDDEDHERVHERVAAVVVAKDAGMVCTRTPHPQRSANTGPARQRPQPATTRTDPGFPIWSTIPADAMANED